MASTVELKLLADIKEATASIKKFTKETSEGLDSVSKSAKGLFSINIASLAIKGLELLKNSLSEVIDEAAKAEEAEIRLNNALRLAGDVTGSASGHFKELAEEIQNLTTFEDDAVLKQIAYIKSLGATNAETDKIIKASVQLSTVMDQDLGTSVQALVKSFSGSSRELKRNVKEIGELSESQLKAGAAADILAAKFAGSAEALRSTFSGAVKAAKNDFGNLLESIGNFVVKNELVIQTIKVLSFIMRGLTVVINEVKVIFDALIAVFLTGSAAASLLGAKINNIFTGKRTAEIAELEKAIDRLKKPITEFGSRTKEVFGGLKKDAKESGKGLAAGFDESAQDIENKLKSLRENLKKSNSGLSDIGKVQKEFDLQKELILKAEKLKLINGKETIELLRLAQDDANKKSAELQKKLDADRINEIKANPFTFFSPKDEQGKTEPVIKLDQKDLEIATLGFAGLTDVLQGAKGVTTAITQGLTFLLGPLGGLIGQVFEVFAQGPEAAAAFVTGFIEAIPTIIENIILAIPAVIQALVDSIPILVSTLVQQIPGIAIKVGIELAAQAPFIAAKMAAAFIREIPNMVRGLVTGIVDAIKQAIGSIGNLFGGGGEGGGIFGGGGFLGLGFAQGGGVKRVPSGFPNDSFPARLTSDELVIDRSASDRLSNLLEQDSRNGNSGILEEIRSLLKNQSGNSQNLSLTMQIGEEQLAAAMVNLNRQGFKTA